MLINKERGKLLAHGITAKQQCNSFLVNLEAMIVGLAEGYWNTVGVWRFLPKQSCFITVPDLSNVPVFIFDLFL